MTDRQLLLVILAILVAVLVAALDYTLRTADFPARLLFDISAVWVLLYLGYLGGRNS